MSTSDRFSRRTFLTLAGAGGAGGLLVGCGSGVEENGGPSGAPTAGDFPTDDVNFRFLEVGPGAHSPFFEQFFADYHAEHPNITIQYEERQWPDVAELVPLGIQNGNAPDVFRLPLNVTPAQAVQQGWVAPMDEIVPDFDTWTQAFPPGLLVEGVNMFNGKPYGVPLGSGKRYGTFMIYNRQMLEDVGYDPASEPLTWDNFRDAAKKVTAGGGGDVYGWVEGGKQTNRWSDVVLNLAEMAGSGTTSFSGGPMDWATGEFAFTSDEVIGAIELLQAMLEDGSIYPGTLNLDPKTARATVPQGQTAMVLTGPWDVENFQRDYPDFDFGVASQPLPNAGSAVPLGTTPGGSHVLYVYAGSPNLAVAGDIFGQLASPEKQRMFAEQVGIAVLPLDPSTLDDVELDDQQQQAVDLFAEQVVLAPDPRVRNPEITNVELEWQGVQPNLGVTIQGILTGQVDDVGQAMQQLQDQYNAELDRAIEAAQAEGAEVSRDDYVIGNWVPGAEYGDDQYAQL